MLTSHVIEYWSHAGYLADQDSPPPFLSYKPGTSVGIAPKYSMSVSCALLSVGEGHWSQDLRTEPKPKSDESTFRI